MDATYPITGLVKSKKMPKPPDDVTRMRRSSKYDKLIEDAQTTTVKLTLGNEKRTVNVYLALRERIGRVAKGKVKVVKRGNNIYAFPAKFAKKTKRFDGGKQVARKSPTN